MLGSTDQVQILALDLVHHVFHLGKAHDAGHHVTVDHERRHHIGEAPVDHEIPGVAQDRAVQPGNVSHQVIEAVAAGLAGRVQVNAGQPLHDIHVVGNFPFRHHGLTVALDFHVLAVILADRYAVIDDVGNHQHPFADLGLQLVFLCFQRGKLFGHGVHFRLDLLGLFLQALSQQAADLLGHGLALVAQVVALLDRFPVFLVHADHFIHHGQLLILELFPDVLPNLLGIISEQINV